MSDLLTLDQTYLLEVYKRIPLKIAKGKKDLLIDDNGKQYLDMFSGVAVNALGYQNRLINKAIKKQIKKHLHISNYFVNDEVIKLANSLIEKTKLSKVFFTNSGTEANEAAIKLARKFGKSICEDKIEIISLNASFHGRTIGGLSLTGQPHKKQSFEPLMDKVIHIPRNDIYELRNKVSDKTCAIFIELIQGESGVNLLSKTFINEIMTLSHQYNFLIVIDEIQTGLMRTGTLFAYEQFDVVPDIVTIAKALGGGLPLGAMMVNEKLSKVLNVGDHGSTFGGNPVSCAAGNACFKQLLKLSAEVNDKGKILLDELYRLKAKYPHIIKDVRGLGLMLGVDVGEYANSIFDEALKARILLNITNKRVIRLLPPLSITKKHLYQFIKTFESILMNIGKLDD